MTNKSIKLFSASALAISALGLSAVATSMTAEAATVTQRTDKVEYVSNAFATFESAKSFTDSNDMYAGFVGRFSIYPVDTSNASKGYVIVGHVDGFFDEADSTQGYANVSALMTSADATAAASWQSTPQPTPTEPTTPTEPEAPVTPVEPTTPTQPEAPVTPVEPTTPTKPEAPVIPVEPTAPTEPETPVTPTEPTTPVTPTAPITPVISTNSIEVSNNQKSSTTKEEIKKVIPNHSTETNKKDVKTLPNTGDADSLLSIIGSGLLSLGGYVALKRK